VEEPIPKTVVEFLTFPFTLVGLLLLLLFFNYWLRLKKVSIKSGDKVDNKAATEKIATVRKEILIVLLIFAIAIFSFFGHLVAWSSTQLSPPSQPPNAIASNQIATIHPRLFRVEF
jgi:hypothetical protein